MFRSLLAGVLLALCATAHGAVLTITFEEPGFPVAGVSGIQSFTTLGVRFENAQLSGIGGPDAYPYLFASGYLGLDIPTRTSPAYPVISMANGQRFDLVGATFGTLGGRGSPITVEGFRNGELIIQVARIGPTGSGTEAVFTTINMLNIDGFRFYSEPYNTGWGVMDNLTLRTVPLPSTALLLSAGLGVIGWMRRR